MISVYLQLLQLSFVVGLLGNIPYGRSEGERREKGKEGR